MVSQPHPGRLVFAGLAVAIGLALAVPGVMFLADADADADDRPLGVLAVALGVVCVLGAVSISTLRLIVDGSGVTAASALRTKSIVARDVREIEQRVGRGGYFFRVQSHDGRHIDFHPYSVRNPEEVEAALRALVPGRD